MKFRFTPAIFILSALVLFSACSGIDKKVLVMASGDIKINGNTITLEPGTRHNESTISPDGDSIIVVTPSGTTGFSVREAGLYLLNLKKDTIVGSYQRLGTDNSQQVISQESLKFRLDSLTQLMAGQNVTATSGNYNIPPFAISRITANMQAQIIGPYVSMPGSFDPSKEHEIYKFYTNKEMADIVSKLSGMVDPNP